MSSSDVTVFLSLIVLYFIIQSIEENKKNTELILSRQAETTNFVSRTSDCTLQEIGEYAVVSEDIKRKYKTSLDECKTDCVNSTQCRAMYYVNRICSIIYKDAQRTTLLGSSYFQKVCHGIYCDVKLLEGQVSDLLNVVSTLNSEIKSLKESLAKVNTTAN